MKSAFALAFLVFLSPQQPDHCAVPSNGSPSLPAKLMDGMGRSDFPITTASREAQTFFNQGISQLYAFWFGEAERSFMQAAAIDPSAGMAYWGIAMSAPGDFKPGYQNLLNPFRKVPVLPAPGSGDYRAREALAKARGLRDKLTERERLYIDAAIALQNPRARNPEADYISAMRKLAAAYPNDVNAKAILALRLDNGFDTVSKKPRNGTEESIALLKEVLRREPTHVGAHHFLIHAYEDSGQGDQAWTSAEIYPKLVPNIPHAIHMPGHIYIQTGRFEDALKAFEAARVNELGYMAADPSYPHDHYFHNELFLIYTLDALGRYKDAITESRNLMSVPETTSERDALDGSSSYRTGWFSLMRTLVRFEKWDEILDGRTLPFNDKPREASWYYWARTLANAAKENASGARADVNDMDWELARLKTLLGLVPPQLYAARAEADAAVSGAPADFDRALRLEADMLYTEPPIYPRPILESQGRRALRNSDFTSAEISYRKLLSREPGSGRALWGLSVALAGQDKAAEAEPVREEFRKAWANADPDLP
jgi:tetratricopeptide (TPR) repeat protein